MRTRHGEAHKGFEPKEEMLKPFKSLPGKGWYVFVGELLHSKTPNIKDTFYVYEILVMDGKKLVGTKYKDRYQMLKLLLNDVQGETDQYYIINNNVWLAKCFISGFKEMFDNLKNKEDEGLVLRDVEATMRDCLSKTSNVKWLVKCRKSTKNYGF